MKKPSKQAGAAQKGSGKSKSKAALPPKSKTPPASQARSTRKAVQPVKRGNGRRGVHHVTSWHPLFIEALSEGRTVRGATKKAGISYQTAYNHYKQYPNFAREWDEAFTEGSDALEDAAYIRAVEGVPYAKFGKEGQLLEEGREYSDTLLALMLKGRLPNKYRDRVEVGGKDDFTPLDEAAAKLAQLRASGRA